LLIYLKYAAAAAATSYPSRVGIGRKNDLGASTPRASRLEFCSLVVSLTPTRVDPAPGSP